MARRLFVILVSSTLLALATAPVEAQPGELEMTLIDQPVWHAPGDSLGLRIRLSNAGSTPIEGYRVTVAAHPRVLSRSELHESFSRPTTFQSSSITPIEAPDEEIGAGETVDRVIDEPVGALQSLADTTESGVYPLQISAVDRSGVVLAALSTQLIYYPSPPEFRLPTVPVVPIAALPRRGPDGTFAALDGEFTLEEAVGTKGWLSGLLRGLDEATTPPPEEPQNDRRNRGRGRDRRRDRRRPRPKPEPEPLHVGVALMPRLAEELADMGNGYAREGEDGQVGPSSDGANSARTALDTIREITARPYVQPILAPYSFPDLPTLFEALTDEAVAGDHLKQHLLDSESVWVRTFDEAPTRDWIYVPGGRLSHAPLEELQQLQAARFTFFAEDSLEPLEDPAGGGCPEPPLSFTCPVEVTTAFDSATGYVLDGGLQERVGDIAASEDDRSSYQRLFAETAVIREEVPSRTDRVVAIGLPSFWEPPPKMTRLLFTGLRDAPWLRTVTPREGLAALADRLEPAERRVRFGVSRLANGPDGDYVEEIEDAHELIEGFRTVQPPPPLLERLTRNMLVSESRAWWSNPTLRLEGGRYAESAVDETERELGQITIGGSDEIALTSRQAEVPVVVFNDAAYDVSVTVRIRSAELQLDETFHETVQARGLRQLSVDVAAQSSGIFTIDVTVETPKGQEIDTSAVQVRSTEFNEIALGLTFGALAFLILFYVTRAIRGRSTPEEGRTT